MSRKVFSSVIASCVMAQFLTSCALYHAWEEKITMDKLLGTMEGISRTINEKGMDSPDVAQEASKALSIRRGLSWTTEEYAATLSKQLKDPYYAKAYGGSGIRGDHGSSIVVLSKSNPDQELEIAMNKNGELIDCKVHPTPKMELKGFVDAVKSSGIKSEETRVSAYSAFASTRDDIAMQALQQQLQEEFPSPRYAVSNSHFRKDPHYGASCTEIVDNPTKEVFQLLFDDKGRMIDYFAGEPR